MSLDIIEHAYLVFVPNVTRPSSFMAVCFSPFDHFNSFSSRIDVTKTQTYGWEMEWGAVGSQETFPAFYSKIVSIVWWKPSDNFVQSLRPHSPSPYPTFLCLDLEVDSGPFRHFY